MNSIRNPLSNKLKPIKGLKESCQISVDLICKITVQEYKHLPSSLQDLFVDLAALYEGNWPGFESCQVGYHNLDHALDVALAVARMSAGWNRVMSDRPISEDLFLAGIAAALFHDAGYIKDKGDSEGRGGKYTFNHVKRSMRIAGDYLRVKKWPLSAVDLVPKMIAPTDFIKELDFDSFSDTYNEEIMARMVSTADLVAQVADVDYLVRINDLFDELKEAYQFESSEFLTAKGIHIYTSAQEMINSTLTFYEQFALPRLKSLGHMDRYLVSFFIDGRNPYQENIAANLSGHLIYSRKQWNRLGEILIQLGIVTHEQVERAVEQQFRQESRAKETEKSIAGITNKNLMTWMKKSTATHRLGEILMEMDAVDSNELCQGLLAQILPPAVEETLSRRDMIFLLKISLLLHNYNQGAQILNYILATTRDYLNCESCSVRLVDHEAGEIAVVLPTGVRTSSEKDAPLPMDKGLAGWAYRHGRAVSMPSDLLDERFADGLKAAVNHQPRSILVVPFHINGEWVGVIELLNKKDDKFTEHDKKIVTSLVNILGSVLGKIMGNPNNISDRSLN